MSYKHSFFITTFWLFIILDIQEFYELALQDESNSVTDEDISIAHKYIMDQFDGKVGLVIIIFFRIKLMEFHCLVILLKSFQKLIYHLIFKNYSKL